ncbi:hypothetical protein GS397_22805 [Sphingobium yanoikuyae]|uniref:Acylphosphatase n=1 Tax=Sphingobium yanoikuyae TaxID=13690 RepID=A0A6P1GMF8_SPHYA|nr:hypothetical protein [Sphingobium yanoikuyae]QHD69590.1 hypothetical protein GS397_22805 [Sphingobium yanoikuyae]
MILRIFIRGDQLADANHLVSKVRLRAAELGLTDVTPLNEAGGHVIEITGGEEALRRFWANAADLSGLGLTVLQRADEQRAGGSASQESTH